MLTWRRLETCRQCAESHQVVFTGTHLSTHGGIACTDPDLSTWPETYLRNPTVRVDFRPRLNMLIEA